MKIVESQVTKLLISDIPRFDPITVVLEDFGEGRGKIIIEEYGTSYAAYWGAMGGRLADFVAQCSPDYIATKVSNMPYQVFDGEGQCRQIRKNILRCRRQKEISAGDARELYDEADGIINVKDPFSDQLLHKFLGADVNWYDAIMFTTNPDYKRLMDLVGHVQKALIQWRATQ